MSDHFTTDLFSPGQRGVDRCEPRGHGWIPTQVTRPGFALDPQWDLQEAADG